MRPLALVLVSIGLGLGGLLLWRSALSDVGGFQLAAEGSVGQLVKLASQWRFWLGALLLFGVVLVSLDLYGNEELSRVVPLYSLSYVAIALLDQFVLGETVPAIRWVAIGLIVAGVVILTRS